MAQLAFRAVAGDPADLQIMYGIAGSGGWTNASWIGCRVLKGRGLCVWETPPAHSFSSTFLERCSTPPIRRLFMGRRATRMRGRF